MPGELGDSEIMVGERLPNFGVRCGFIPERSTRAGTRTAPSQELWRPRWGGGVPARVAAEEKRDLLLVHADLMYT